jgi:hypothetical protein
MIASLLQNGYLPRLFKEDKPFSILDLWYGAYAAG